MAEVISLSTFHNHNLTDQDHALFMQTVTSQSGLFYGCEVTLKDENTLHVSTGEGIACGRIFRIMDMDYPVELSASGDLLGRLYVHIDTALDDTPAQLMDVQGSTLPALIQEDDMNQSTGVYEIELATFSINELGISDLEFTAPKATGGGAGGKSIAPDYSATESYEKGRIFFQNGTMYKTIAAIPAGAPLVVDTNVVETSLAAEIEALNQNLTYRYNETTDYFQALVNGNWVNDRYAGLKGLIVYNHGTFNYEMSHKQGQVYVTFTDYSATVPWTVNQDNLSLNVNAEWVTGQKNMSTISTDNIVNVTGKRVKVDFYVGDDSTNVQTVQTQVCNNDGYIVLSGEFDYTSNKFTSQVYVVPNASGTFGTAGSDVIANVKMIEPTVSAGTIHVVKVYAE